MFNEWRLQIEFARCARAHRTDWATRRADVDVFWQELQASNRLLIAVTNQLLLMAQADLADAGSRLVSADLGAAALHGVEQLAALAGCRHIDLGLEAPVDRDFMVHAEPALLDALVSNLLDNALRYTQEGGRVTVLVRRGQAQVELQVQDNGPGIPAEARERVFERFYSPVARWRRHGTGPGDRARGGARLRCSLPAATACREVHAGAGGSAAADRVPT